MWLAVDPPGRPERSIGSVIATATAGPLRHGFGPVRDHVLGCTVATGDGRLVNAGGRVVKNVAGYDLTKLQVGGFGGFGIIADVHLRLRALPRADVTLLARGARDALTSAARELMSAHLLPSALELLSPALAAEAEWVLAARFVGTDAAVQADVRRLGSVGEPALAAASGRSHRGVLERGRARQSWRPHHAAARRAGRRRGRSHRPPGPRPRRGAGLGRRGTGNDPLDRRCAARAAPLAAPGRGRPRDPHDARARALGRSGGRSDTSVPTARAWARSSAGCATPSTPASA